MSALFSLSVSLASTRICYRPGRSGISQSRAVAVILIEVSGEIRDVAAAVKFVLQNFELS